ncbi:MAG: TVP38/TMEM64 family protein [Gammaproteobacteria bacterium]
MIKRWLPLTILIILLALFFYFRLYQYLSFDMLKAHRNELLLWREQHLFIAIIVFMVIYILAVAISIPGATLLTLIGGFLFGSWLGTLLVVVSATIGAIIIFGAVNTAFGESLVQKTTGKLKAFEKGFAENAFSYSMILRLIPIFPFWLINVASPLLSVPFRTFAITTFIGIIPGTFVYVWLGSGLGAVFDKNQTLDLNIIFKPYILLPLIGLALLSLLPVIYHHLRKNRANQH